MQSAFERNGATGAGFSLILAIAHHVALIGGKKRCMPLGDRGAAPWTVDVARAGTYQIALRRWSTAIQLALAKGMGKRGKKLPIVGGKIAAAGRESSAAATPCASSIAIQIQLPKGPTALQGWFQDSAGHDLCGAFSAAVRRLSDDKIKTDPEK